MDAKCAACGHGPPLVALRERPSPHLRGVPGADPNAPVWETVCDWQSGCMAPDSVRRVTGIGWRVACAHPEKCPQHRAEPGQRLAQATRSLATAYTMGG